MGRWPVDKYILDVGDPDGHYDLSEIGKWAAGDIAERHNADCEGRIPAEYTKLLADRLTSLVPLLSGPWKKKTRQFIDGLLDAHSNNEDVEFR